MGRLNHILTPDNLCIVQFICKLTKCFIVDLNIIKIKDRWFKMALCSKVNSGDPVSYLRWDLGESRIGMVPHEFISGCNWCFLTLGHVFRRDGCRDGRWTLGFLSGGYGCACFHSHTAPARGKEGLVTDTETTHTFQAVNHRFQPIGWLAASKQAPYQNLNLQMLLHQKHRQLQKKQKHSYKLKTYEKVCYNFLLWEYSVIIK